MLEVGTVAHFFGEDIRWIAFTTDVTGGDTAILNPFAGGILAMFDVTVSLCGVSFYNVKCYLMNWIPVPRFFFYLVFPGGFRFSAYSY